MVLTPSAPWIEWTIQPQMAVADEISYKIKGSPKENDEALTEDELQLVQMCNSINPAALYNSFADKKKFRRQADFEEKADDDIRKYVHTYADAKLGKCIETAFAIGVPMFVRRKHIDGIYIDKQLTLNDELNPLIGFHKGEETTKYVLQFEYPDDEHTVCTPSQCKWVVLNEEPGLVLEDDTRVFTLPEGFSGKRVKPFLAKEAIMVPSRTEREYFRKFIWKNVSDADLDVSGFELDNVEVEPKSFIILNRSKKGDPTLKLCFQYNNHIVYTGNVQKRFVSFKEQDESFRFLCIDRQFDKEQAATDAVVALGCTPAEGTFFQLDYTPQRNRWCQLMEWYRNNREALAAAGVALIQKRMSPQVFLGDFKIEQGFSKLNDWFELHLTIRLDDKRAITIGDIRENILDDNPEYLMPEGDIFIIPDELMAQYAKAMLVARRGKRGGLLVHRSAWGQTDLQTDDTVDEIADAPVPSALKAELRSYQTEGYRWMYRLQQYNCGACLADDMGLGKTLQTITLLLNYMEGKTLYSMAFDGMNDLFSAPAPDQLYKTSLIVAPASLVYNWKAEISRFAPSINVLDYTGPEYKRKAKQQTMQRWDVVITTYHTLRNDVDFLETVPFGYVVFDESQNFKNRTSQLYHSVTQLQSEHRLALSGTPIENSLGDLWSLMEVLNPGLLGGFTDFSRLYMQPISEQIEEKRTAALRQIVAPYILRRTKEQVLTDLPERTDELMVCLMDSEQKKVYDEQVSSVRNLIITTGESATHSTAILAGLMRIRQIANHPRLPELTKEGSTLKPADLSINESGKLKAVFCHLENIVSSGHKALIFSDFVNLLEIVSAEFDRRGWKFVQLTGSTQNREDVVNRFQNDADCPFFLISLKAGGVGLNLTAADYVLLLDPWWNTAAEEQAICRAYRMGQQNPVFVYRYVSESTLEERILHLQRNKQTLAEAVLNSHLLDAEPLNE